MKSNYLFSHKKIYIFIVVLIIIICSVLFYYRYNIKLWFNHKVLLPIGNKNHILYQSLGIDHRGIFVYNLDYRKINKIIKNRRTKKNDNKQLDKIFNEVIEGQYGFFNDINICEYIDRDKLTSEEMYYIFIEDIYCKENEKVTKCRLSDFELFIIDIVNNKIYEIYSA